MKEISAKKFDEKFDNGESIIEYLDINNIKKINEEQMRVSVDFPKWIIQSLDKESRHLGISRQALIKLSVVQHIKENRFL